MKPYVITIARQYGSGGRTVGKMLARNMLIYGLGGIVTPFVGIKLIDMLIVAPLLSLIVF